MKSIYLAVWCLSAVSSFQPATLIQRSANLRLPLYMNSPPVHLKPIKTINGEITLPGSKSLSNRVLLLSALSEGTTKVENLLDSADIRYMVDALHQVRGRSRPIPF
jgi:3-phosphoshikimate 1-carboxyvinyltransferase